VRKPTWLNGFVGTGRVVTAKYCEDPVRTELQVRATDVLISIATLLIYIPHTLYVTCGVPLDDARTAARIERMHVDEDPAPFEPDAGPGAGDDEDWRRSDPP